MAPIPPNKGGVPNCRLRKSGGQREDLNESIILDRLNTFFPNWKEATITIPPFAVPKYDGPVGIGVGMQGVDPKVEASHLGQIRGQENEVRALKKVENFSQKKNLNLKIFQGVNVTCHKIDPLCEMFQMDLDWDEAIEIDIAAVSESCLWLIEVKSSTVFSKKAFSQLNKIEFFFGELSKSLGCKGNTPIRKMFAAPVPFDEKFIREAKAQNIHCLDLDSDDEVLAGLMKPDSCGKMDNYKRLVGSLAFLTCCHSFSFDQRLEEQLENACLEGSQSQEIVDKLDRHGHLEKWRHPAVEMRSWKRPGDPGAPTSLRNHDFIWLDPNQSKILNDLHPFQIILGPASTGKTVLVQLKILDVISKNNAATVLLVVPYPILKQKYEKFFDDANLGQLRKSITIITADEDFFDYIDNMPHIFVDEFCASVTLSQNFSKNFERLMTCCQQAGQHSVLYHPKTKEALLGKIVWITADFKQSLGNTWCESYDANFVFKHHPFVKTFLGMIHRCTNEVQKSYSHYSGPLAATKCHQHDGVPTLHVKISDGKISRKIHELIAHEESKGHKLKDIAVIYVPSHPNIVYAYFKMKAEFKNTFLESETLSHEWPVVIVCLAVNKSVGAFHETTSYVAFSRAVFKLTVVTYETTDADENFESGNGWFN